MNYELENGATVSIRDGHALDYSIMRANQLNALLGAMVSPGFSECSEHIKTDCLWLARTLSSEIAPLLEIVAKQAKKEVQK
jgi:hypothetical protein